VARRPGLLARIEAARSAGRGELAWPTGRYDDVDVTGPSGHDQSEFSPEEYGDYIATSNDVYSAVTLRARLMSSLTLRLFDRDGAGRTEVSQGPAYDVLRHVNPHWTRRRLARMDEMSMGLWGESFWAVHREGGVPVETWWMKPSRVQPVPHPERYLAGFIYTSSSGERVPFLPDEVVWFRYPNPLDEFSPLSPVAAARLAADTSAAMMKSNRNLHSQGLSVGGFITPKDDRVTFSPEQADELEMLLERRWSGAKNAKKWAVLRFDAAFQAMNVTPKDAEFVEGMNLTLRQTANAYGIPVTLLNDFANATLSNAREHKLLLWEHSLVPDSKDRAEEIIEQFLPMFPDRLRPGHAEYDYSEVPALQQANSESWMRERQAIEAGALLINEWRKDKGLPPLPWGDKWWGPVNKGAIEDEADVTPGGVGADPATQSGKPTSALMRALAFEMDKEVSPA
jgi:HK97 family phage portal protein